VERKAGDKLAKKAEAQKVVGKRGQGRRRLRWETVWRRPGKSWRGMENKNKRQRELEAVDRERSDRKARKRIGRKKKVNRTMVNLTPHERDLREEYYTLPAPHVKFVNTSMKKTGQPTTTVLKRVNG